MRLYYDYAAIHPESVVVEIALVRNVKFEVQRIGFSESAMGKCRIYVVTGQNSDYA
jgi:hypothetical protein